MNLLLDTHVILWALSEPERIAEPALKVLAAPDSQVWISSISLWEIAIKLRLGKLKAPAGWGSAAEALGQRVLAFEARHAYAISELPLHHGDPFDRALLAQARAERFHLMSADRAVWRYETSVNILKC